MCLKRMYYEINTFPGIWGDVLGLWCSHTHTNLEKIMYMIFWVRYAFLRVPRLQLANERVSFGAPFYVGRGHILILPPTSPRPPIQDFVDQRTSNSGVGSSAAELELIYYEYLLGKHHNMSP